MTNEEVLEDLLKNFNFEEAARIFHCYPSKAIDISHTIEKFNKFAVVMFNEISIMIEELKLSHSQIPHTIIKKRRNLVLMRIGGVYNLWYVPVKYPNKVEDAEVDEEA